MTPFLPPLKLVSGKPKAALKIPFKNVLSEESSWLTSVELTPHVLHAHGALDFDYGFDWFWLESVSQS